MKIIPLGKINAHIATHKYCRRSRWKKVKGFNCLALILEEKTFKDGALEDNSKQAAA